jgi:hypothetical protein
VNQAAASRDMVVFETSRYIRLRVAGGKTLNGFLLLGPFMTKPVDAQRIIDACDCGLPILFRHPHTAMTGCAILGWS